MSLSNGVHSLFCFAALLTCAAYGLETETLKADLIVEYIVYRDSPGDSSHKEVIAEFTSTFEPDVEFTHGDSEGRTVVLDPDMHFSDGRGTVSTQFPAGSTRSLALDIGYFPYHSLSFALYLPEDSPGFNKTYNSKMSKVSPGYEFTYVPGTDNSFEVTASVPKSVANGYTWKKNFRSREVPPKVGACYVDQETQDIVSSMQSLDKITPSFLTVHQQITEDEASFTLTFDTTQETVSGYFQISAQSTDDESSVRVPGLLRPLRMSWIREEILFSVHDDTTEGPFPEGYSYVRNSRNRYVKHCTGRSTCMIFCYGYANGIAEADIFKNQTGTLTKVPDVIVRQRNDNLATFFALLDTSGDFAGEYVCRVTPREGRPAERTFTVT